MRPRPRDLVVIKPAWSYAERLHLRDPDPECLFLSHRESYTAKLDSGRGRTQENFRPCTSLLAALPDSNG